MNLMYGFSYLHLSTHLYTFKTVFSISPTNHLVVILQGPNTEHDVLHLSDSSPAKTTTPHSPSELEMSLHQALINRRDFPHNLLITSPPLDLWALFKETLLAKKNV